ncbi:hypothetical protein LXM94_07220 [Rhizobium sp. TRM95111]|uniref:hypothetical protein n=1 Tax=Rhizobium alarense TaxID=2846851 RepID=UPI001F1A760D|nr:hypothetical protein [Rhizobium alarense]MCF3639759.1 hypothetical protein [Rhizobium alarense]
MRTGLAALALLMAASAASAGPEGTFDVVGTNPDDNGRYEGTVTVKRTGETYAVVWDVAGTRFVGIGIGARPAGTAAAFSKASQGDTALSVGYGSGEAHGVAVYEEQPDGSWAGIWTYAGSPVVSTEVWYPKGKPKMRTTTAGNQPAMSVKPTGDYTVRP